MMKDELLNALLKKFMASSDKLDGTRTTQFAVLAAMVRALQLDPKLGGEHRGLSALSSLLQAV